LYLLQTRSGKRGGKAAVEIAVSLFNEGIVTKEAALHMVTPEHLDIMLHPQFEDTNSDEYKAAVIGEGLPASPGAVRKLICTFESKPPGFHACSVVCGK
jgi:pyruvate,orthophosphate dikinase